ncbi:alpha/beta fold hydrolase [Micromonospora sp. CPCC 206061]|uniref:alpha/beta fold hydrolase n=1 Tax=Micromonospora sp. CPCC 206061 TaxID=3122410 RepID=UPI002FF1C6FC
MQSSVFSNEVRIGRRILAAVTILVALLALPAAVGIPFASGDVARFASRPVMWTDCPAEDLRAAGARCAEISVPLDYSVPHGATITIAVSRIEARDTARRRGILLFNPGGPGGPGLSYPAELRPVLGEVADQYDLIGFDPRFVGLSTPISCGGIGEYVRAAGLSWRDYAESVEYARDVARRCWRAAAHYIPYASTRNTARDMDVIRAVLGEPRLSYVGVSYGTYLGAVYTQMFPERADRIVLDSAVDPDGYPVHADWSTGSATESAFDEWAAWAARHHKRFGFGTTGVRVRATVRGLLERAARVPIRVGEYTVDEQVIPLLITFYLADAGSDEPLAEVVGQLRAAARGRPAADPHLLANLAALYGKDGSDDGAALSITCGDGEFPRDPLWYWRNIEQVRGGQPFFGPLARNISPCAFWRSRPLERPTVVRNDSPALIVHATGDVWTPYADALALHERLTGSRLVTLAGVRTHGVFGGVPNACVERHVKTYLHTGVLPAADVTCRPERQ